jgi:Flp pilus assembly protein TadG
MIMKLLRYLRDERGAAAVEMALLTPFITTIVVAMVTIAPLMWTKQSMHVAVNTGSQYVMAGATNTTAIQQVALTGWSHRPDDGTITVTQYCTCAGVTASCNTICGSAPPTRYTLITAGTTYHGLTGNTALSSQQLIRTR